MNIPTRLAGHDCGAPNWVQGHRHGGSRSRTEILEGDVLRAIPVEHRGTGVKNLGHVDIDPCIADFRPLGDA